jgi:hypothetical protein
VQLDVRRSTFSSGGIVTLTSTARRVVGALALTLAPAVADAQPLTFMVMLTGSQEVPPVATPASGMATLMVNPGTLQVQLMSMTFQNLTSNTLAVGGASGHLHRGAPGETGPILVPFPSCPIGVTSGSCAPATFTVTQAVMDDILAFRSYVNLHTVNFPSGELRGNLTASSVVPEPSTYALLASGLVMVGMVARRRKA